MRKMVLFLWAIVLVFLITIIQNNLSIETASYGWGSRGNTVIEIQKRLKNWGYYTGNVDGIYGYKTYIAVKNFQTKNGLYPDGIVGPKTLAALGISEYSAQRGYSGSQNYELLSRLISGEARGEPYIGQVAVGGVVLNRTRDPRFPSTIPGVIYQPGAFTAVSDGQINLSPTDSARKASSDALNGWDPSGGALYYYNPAKTTNKWIWSRPIIKIIGDHYFCK
ncbi:Spore cortex-lytic enzyme precursor [Caloramator mitchellensis]|uniref:Spore cortex-lytic enzyme n=1 Tax=Caloramator mitchellensis TaxID=908809 RepID=A0A0R3K3S0_CALMK|nr:spore cortex-lytic enzyme [Caloramator mitchellensis]KRQ87996.1 Spore cortex-lytic enzyme precursor [Caloramator mitchellensis]